MEKTYTGATTLVEKRVKAWTSDILNPRVQTVRRSYAAAGMPAKIGRWNLPYPGMATGGSYICGELGIPTIGIGPGKEEDAHSINEKVSAGSVTKAVYGIAAVVHGTIGAPVYGWSSEDI